MRKIFVIFVLFVAAASMKAQTPASRSDWSKVQALRPGTSVSVKTRTHSLPCKVAAVTADALTCAGTPALARAEILQIKVHRRALSSLVGFGVGGGLGAGIGAGIGSSNQIGGRGLPALVFGVAAAVVGAIIGVATDFLQSTIYRAP